jgi:hypothetical protein
MEDLKNAIVGSWQLSSVQINGTDVDLTAYPDIIQFQANYIFESKNSTNNETVRGGWSYEGDMLNISVYLPAAFYIVKVDSQNLILKRLDFNSSGLLIETILNYRKL